MNDRTSDEQHERCLRDAEYLLQHSHEVALCYHAMILSARLQRCADILLQHHLHHGWEVHDPQGVRAAVVRAASIAGAEPFSAKELMGTVCAVGVPLADLFLRQELHNADRGGSIAETGLAEPSGGEGT